MIRTIIIDDEVNIRSLLKQILKDHCTGVEVVAEAGSVVASLEAIRRLHPELILLDIRLEDGTGFDLLEKLGAGHPYVIFITAFEEFALKAFRLSAVDYLMKPVVPEELAEAIGKVRHAMSNHHDNRVRVLIENANNPNLQEKKIVLRTADKFHFVALSDVIRCESDSSYTTFFLVGQPPVVVCKTLKDYEDLLGDFGFYRPHKSNIINLKHIRAFEKSDGGFIIMSDDAKVPLSDRKREEFFGMMDKM
jgi:two-component system, LytTR family, response regulator